MALIYTSQKSKWSRKKGVKPYAAAKKLPANLQGVYKPIETFVRETKHIPSLVSVGYSSCAKKEDKIYTGDKLIGIGTMHKSNAVPIFNDNEAKDISTMRRG